MKFTEERVPLPISFVAVPPVPVNEMFLSVVMAGLKPVDQLPVPLDHTESAPAAV
jgi:hypothetical protein